MFDCLLNWRQVLSYQYFVSFDWTKRSNGEKAIVFLFNYFAKLDRKN